MSKYPTPVHYPAGTVKSSTPWVDWFNQHQVYGTTTVLPPLSVALDYVAQLEEELRANTDYARCTGCGRVTNKDYLDAGPEDDDGHDTWYCEGCQN